jgi:hypothetical protein
VAASLQDLETRARDACGQLLRVGRRRDDILGTNQHYYLLTLSQGRVNFFKGNANGLASVDLRDLPHSLEEALGTEDRTDAYPGLEEHAFKLRQYRDGDRVRHARWGDGIVVMSKLTRSDEEITVAFKDPSVGRKTVLASLANLEVVG